MDLRNDCTELRLLGIYTSLILCAAKATGGLDLKYDTIMLPALGSYIVSGVICVVALIRFLLNDKRKRR